MKPFRFTSAFAAALLLAQACALPAWAEASKAAAPTNAAAAAIAASNAREERPDPAQTVALARQGALLLDVRSLDEWNAGHAKGAVFLPWRQVGDEAASKLPDKQAPIVTYCAAGVRAWYAARSLRELGYTRVTAMTGGFSDLKNLGFTAAP